MNRKEALAALKKARYVFGWVNHSENDGAYLQLLKSSVRYALRDPNPDIRYSYVMRDDGDLYIG